MRLQAIRKDSSEKVFRLATANQKSCANHDTFSLPLFRKLNDVNM